MFEEYVPINNCASSVAVPSDKVTITTRLTPGRNKRTMLIFNLGRDVARALGLHAEDCPGAKVLFGVGPDLGKVKIAPASKGAPAGKVKVGKRSLSVRIHVTNFPTGLYGGGEYKSFAVFHEDLSNSASGKQILVMLPKDFSKPVPVSSRPVSAAPKAKAS